MSETIEEPVATVEHLNNCQYSSWHRLYSKLAPKSKIIKPLPKEFVEYLLEDGITLPKEEYHWKYREESAESKESSSDDDDSEPTDRFQRLHADIRSIITSFKAVCPKLNWSAPKDATWIATSNNMRCLTPSDVYILLKASNYITHDLTEAYAAASDRITSDGEITNPESYELVLRSWFDINPSLEFRCFVRDSVLVGISQRDMNYYEFLEPLKPKLQMQIEDFFNQNLKDTFPDPSYVFDVYVPRPFDRVWLIDINPFAAKTDTLLFSWDHILQHSSKTLDFRLVNKPDRSRGFGTVEHTESYVPKDFVDAGMAGLSISDMTESWKQILATQENSEDEDVAEDRNQEENHKCI